MAVPAICDSSFGPRKASSTSQFAASRCQAWPAVSRAGSGYSMSVQLSAAKRTAPKLVTSGLGSSTSSTSDSVSSSPFSCEKVARAPLAPPPSATATVALFVRKGEPPSAVHWYVASCADASGEEERRGAAASASASTRGCGAILRVAWVPNGPTEKLRLCF